jgi:hypothetical protein
MPTYTDIRLRVRERLVTRLGELATDNDVRVICQNIYVAFMASLDLRPKHLTAAELDELLESVDALWAEELELFAQAAKGTLEESLRQGRSPAEAAIYLQTTIAQEFLTASDQFRDGSHSESS